MLQAAETPRNHAAEKSVLRPCQGIPPTRPLFFRLEPILPPATPGLGVMVGLRGGWCDGDVVEDGFALAGVGELAERHPVAARC